MSNTMNAVRCPSDGAKYIASGFQRSAAAWMSLPMFPSLTARLPDSTGTVILAITRMTTPPPGAAVPVRRFPLRLARRVSSSCIDCEAASREALARHSACLGAVYAGAAQSGQACGCTGLALTDQGGLKDRFRVREFLQTIMLSRLGN